jgi:hypothetical protein
MSKIPGLSAQAKRDAVPLGEIVDAWRGPSIKLVTWQDSEQIGLLQGHDAVVIDKDQAHALIAYLQDFIK